MKKLILPLLLLLSLGVFAQGKEKAQEKREQIKALKVSFFTTELKLTADESEKFWPVYNVYEEQEYNIRHNKMRKLMKKIDDVGIDKIPDRDALSYLNQMEDAEEELFNVRRKMVGDLRAIIGPARMLKLKKAERDFNKKLLDKYKENKKD
ncbi:sensor of ECF-type sigma factor [uncultured Flavobacterium sp.]|uniref:sensor of ECF-type sigma factor n=1 Tax=uncultured Flavobacterium sp. TaxID=165435 RepID=UPI0025FF0554|nr:sensor of ECF-type sigma factor [uncultured Flavobacterium sp.]